MSPSLLLYLLPPPLILPLRPSLPPSYGLSPSHTYKTKEKDKEKQRT